MSVCPACGHEDRAGAKFCPECGAALAATPTPAREERKVVTVLFADLVGFTSRSEQLDPEDVRALLSPYYARLRTELESFGGTVEKFIGDAVMALFGAPVAHEDDPERAVRAALAIRDWVVEQAGDLQLRIAVNTGEALIALGAHPGQGEGMASGDVVNTTARLQTAAPVNGILVGESTYRATSQVITYRAAEPVSAKGKALPVPAWEALEARSRFGVDLARVSRAPLAGRTREVNVLSDALERVRSDRATQLVTLAGVPGMGKSRLVAELFRVADAAPGELIAWRQGRSLPYGDGVTFWALAEMVKAQAGILETDTPEQAEAKLRAAVSGLLADPTDARWVEGHLRPLAGLSSGAEGSGDRHEEAFAAWRRFFEALAERGPLVLVFEDLHWADDNLLDFVEHLVGWASGVPLLVVCTARPELFERRPGWGGGALRNSTTLWLSPLTEAETAQLISSLSDRPVMDAAMQQALLERAGGNPLYAEQYLRMLEERGDAAELALPETVQGIIAARLDALPAEEKRLLQSAAVVGKVFWLGSLGQVGGFDRHEAETHLHALERKDFVQRARRSSVAEESEFAFLHVLVRDVAYGQIPRGQRGEQHRLAAEWIASLGRTEDHAEMLAHHYRNAIELRRAAGQPIDPALAERALASLRDAGDRAFALNAFPSAAGFYEAALELAARGSMEHARLLFHLGRTQQIQGNSAAELLTTASDELLACGDREMAAEAEAQLSRVIWRRGERDLALAHTARAQELADGLAPSRAKVRVMTTASSDLMLAGNFREAIRLGREALAMAEQLDLDNERAAALTYVGVSRVHSGDPGGIEDLEKGAAIAIAANTEAITNAQANLAAALWELGQLERASAIVEQEAQRVSRFGLIGETRWFRGDRVGDDYVRGRWQEAVLGADEFLAEVEAGSPHYLSAASYATRARIRLGRDDIAGALADAARAIDLARLAKDPHMLNPTLASCAHVLGESGDQAHALALANEFLAELQAGRDVGAGLSFLHVLAWTLSAQGRGSELIEVLPGNTSPWVKAAAAFASDDLRGAADICGAMGAATEEARDRLWLAESLINKGRRSEADIELQRALAFYRSVGAARYVRQAEGLLAATA